MARTIKLYSVREAAAILSVSAETIRDWINTDRLGAIDICPGKRVIYRVPESAIEKFLRERTKR